MSFTDPRLPGKEYKSERGIKAALRALEKRSAEASAPVETEAPPAPYTGPVFLRNLRDIPIRLRFGDKDGRSVTLRPRGQRGDFTQLQPGEQFDRVLDDAGLLFEVLTDAEIAKVIDGQTTNQQAVHPALAHLLNPTGQKFESPVVIQPEFHAQGVTVATIVDNGPDSKNQSRTVIQRMPQIDLATAPPRSGLAGTQDNPIPGTTVSQSVAPEEQAVYVAEQGGLDALAQRDAVARQKGLEGPQAGLGGLKVGGVDRPLGPVVSTRFDGPDMDPSARTPEAPVSGHAV